MTVKVGYFQCIAFKVVSYENHFIARLLIVVDHHAYGLRIKFAGVWGGESYGEVCSNARLDVEVRPMVNHLLSHIVLRAAYPKGAGFMKPIECFKVNIRLVHHVEGKRF